MKKLSVLLICVLGISCASKPDLASWVNPFTGTGGHGHTFPGATLPNGMVQLSPDTRMTGWDACSGYHYSDNTIIGFSHTHLSGTGIGDYGDVLFMPISGPVSTDRGEENLPGTGYRSGFSHDNETASPGYYRVKLNRGGIVAELTATVRAGMHRYTFPASVPASVIVDLDHSLQGHPNTEMFLEIIGDSELRGYKNTRGWARDQPLFFHAKFSMPFTAQIVEIDGRPAKALLTFPDASGKTLVAKVGISAVDMEGALGNLNAEIAGWDFDRVAGEARKSWNKSLASVEIETPDTTARRIFYTALYHALISPNTSSDVDGRYRAQDRQIKQLPAGETYYTVFSLWDTFRALHPLLTIIDPQRNGEYAATLVRKYEEGGCLPMWDLASCYTGTMIGYHAASVIAEAYLKGAREFDAEKAFEACLHASGYHPFTLPYDRDGRIMADLMPRSKHYRDSLGYIPADAEWESVAKGLEYAYNDWCVAQFARALGKEELYDQFTAKSRFYRNYFDASTGFMRGLLSDGTWRTPFNPRSSNHREDDYCEGNAWQWSWYVPHDVEGLVALYGGREGFIVKLDSLFSITSELEGEKVSSDISGLIGQYAHGNEPSHHITHLYNYVGQPWKTQELVDRILRTLYFDDPNGLAGNEDCGQMSAWYILNAIGLYSVAPASGEYTWGRPLFDRVTIPLPGGKKLRLVVKENTPENKYIQSITIDGKPQQGVTISHAALMSGPLVEITMSSTPLIEN